MKTSRLLSPNILFGISFIILINYHTVSYAQTKIDSLKNELIYVTNDSTSLNLNLLLAKEWEPKNIDSALFYNKQAIHISEKNNWLNEKAKAYINMAFAYYSHRDTEKLFEYLKKGLEFYKKAGDKTGIMNTHYNMGYFYGTFERFPDAIEQFKKAIELAIELNHNKRLSGAYNNIGLMYNYSGMYDKANEYQFKSLEIGEKIGENMAYTHMNIALNYSDNKNHKKSLEHNKKSITLFKELGIKPYIAQGLKAIGDNYSNMFILDSAEYFYNKAYSVFKELDDRESIARHHMVIGNLYDMKELPLKAEKQYQLALSTIPENESKKLRFAIYSNLSDLYLKSNNSFKTNKNVLFNQVINYARIMLKTAKDFESINMELDAYERLYKANKRLGYNRSALKYVDKFVLMKDSLFSEQKQRAITEMQTKYETEKNELEIKVLNSKNELISSELKQSKILHRKKQTIIYILIMGFVMVCIFVFIIYRFYIKTKRINQKLVEQNAIILKQNKEKELLVKEIHHRVKNNLQIISSLFDLQMRSTDNPDTKAALIDGLNRVKSVGLIHQLLYQSDDVINIDFEDFVIKLMDHITSFSCTKPINQSITIPQGLHFDIETTIPLGLIITELLTNAFKYAFDEIETCSILINLGDDSSNQFVLEISDNGSGLPKEFDFNTSKSLGLRLVRNLSKQLNGKIQYKFENGAKFLLTFPK